MASTGQILITLLLLCAVSFLFGWTARDIKGDRIRRFKIRRRKKSGKLYKLPKRYDWHGRIY